MPKIRVVRRLGCPADAAWALVGDFGGLHRWHPLVPRLDLSWEGRIRTLHFADDSRVVESLEARNDAARRYVYALIDGPLSLRTCRSTIEVSTEAQVCMVSWSCLFEPLGDAGARAETALRRYCRVGLDAVAMVLGSS